MLDTLDPATRFAIAAERRDHALRQAADERLARTLPRSRMPLIQPLPILERLAARALALRDRTRRSAILAR
ncbi:MAG: hypothetical protein AAFZ07_01115 [Actinomycetota bacterium]